MRSAPGGEQCFAWVKLHKECCVFALTKCRKKKGDRSVDVCPADNKKVPCLCATCKRCGVFRENRSRATRLIDVIGWDISTCSGTHRMSRDGDLSFEWWICCGNMCRLVGDDLYAVISCQESSGGDGHFC